MLKRLFEHANRGILLDVTVFLVNVLLMTLFSRQLAALLQGKGKTLARASALVLCLTLVFLQPLGAILKRRRAHFRNPKLNHIPLGYLFLPAYFFTQLQFLTFASVNLVNLVLGPGHHPSRGDRLGMPNEGLIYFLFGLPAIAIATSFLFYFYFQPPKHKPLVKFLESAQAESLGDICLFINIIFYQAIWVLFMTRLTSSPIASSTGRFTTFAFFAVLIYFPPRLFYLAEDGKRPVVWLTILLANSPIILRFFFAASPSALSNW